MMRRTGTCFCLLALLVVCLGLLAAPASAWQDDYQSGSTATQFYVSGLTNYVIEVKPSGYTDTFALRMYGYISGGGTGWIRVGELDHPVNYFAFTLKSHGPGGIDTYWFGVFTQSGNLAASIDYTPYLTSANYGKRFEFIRMDQTLCLYIDGVLVKSVNCQSQPYACGFGAYVVDPYGWGGHSDLTIDDLVVGADQPNVIGVIPPDWYIMEHPTDPTLTGLINAAGQTVYTTKMHVSYGVKTDLWGTNYPPDGEYKIKIYRVGSGYAHNITPLNMSRAAGVVEYNLTELFFDNDDAVPGWYSAKLYRGDTLLDEEWFAYTNGGGTISFDASSYVSSQTAVVSHEITYFTLSQYIYEGEIIDTYGTVKESWPITTATGTHNVDLTGYDAGTYFVMLKATDRDTREEYVFDYDLAEVNLEVRVTGKAYNAETGAPMAGVTVNITQFDKSTVNVTIADGSYATVAGLYADNPIYVAASAPGYTHNNFSFIPLENALKIIDIYMVPAAPAFGGDAAIGGLVHNMPYHQAVSGATVTISNTTWNSTTTANSAGYYIFDNLTINETYNLSSSQPGYRPSSGYSATAVNTTFVRQDIEMSGIYSLTIELRDATDHSLIDTSMTVEVNGATNVTTAGRTTFHNLDYGIVTVTVTGNDDYYGVSENILVDGDTTRSIYLTPKTESTPFAYPPHNVKFVVRNAFGAPIEGVTVEAIGYETTMGALSWLFDLLGINYEKTQVYNQTMRGTTGSDGSIDFMMFEAIKYRITFYKEGEVDVVWEGYPKDEYYTIWAPTVGPSEWFEHGVNPLEAVNFTVTGTTATEDEATITVYYNDTLKNTTGAAVYLNQTFTNGTEILVSQYVTGAAPTWNHTFTLPGDHRGESYLVHLRAQHETLGNITRDYGVYYKPAPISFGLPEDLLLYGAMAVMIFTALFFGQSSVGAGCIVFAFEGWLFYWIGWLQDLGSEYAVGTALIIISVVAVLVNVMQRSKRERYA